MRGHMLTCWDTEVRLALTGEQTGGGADEYTQQATNRIQESVRHPVNILFHQTAKERAVR